MELFQGLKHKKAKRVARGGKRGTTAGRGTKGQKSRAGHRIRPAERDLLQRLPKLRGLGVHGGNKSIRKKPLAMNVGELNKLSETLLTRKNLGNVKILGEGELTKAITVEGLKVSKSARKKILKAGGKVQ
mgnify:CR=1 FL=1